MRDTKFLSEFFWIYVRLCYLAIGPGTVGGPVRSDDRIEIERSVGRNLRAPVSPKKILDNIPAVLVINPKKRLFAAKTVPPDPYFQGLLAYPAQEFE